MADQMLNKLRHHWNVSSRREFFTQAGSGLAGIALAAMLAEDEARAATSDPLAPKQPHVVPKAKNIIQSVSWKADEPDGSVRSQAAAGSSHCNL